jgi:hypothetical protein
VKSENLQGEVDGAMPMTMEIREDEKQIAAIPMKQIAAIPMRTDREIDRSGQRTCSLDRHVENP